MLCDAARAEAVASKMDGNVVAIEKPSNRNIVLFDPDLITHVKRDGEMVYKSKGL